MGLLVITVVADRLPSGTFVLVSGPSASGKTTLAQAIASDLGLPLIAKDTINQALMTVLPVQTSRRPTLSAPQAWQRSWQWPQRQPERCWRASGTAAGPD